MKTLLALALCGFAFTAKAAETDDLARIVSLQQAEIQALRDDLTASQTALNNFKATVYTKSEADARSYSKAEADSRFMNQAQSTNYYTRAQSDGLYISTAQASSFQPRISTYWAGCSWDEASRYWTCSCNSGGTAVSVGAGAWGGDSLKAMYYAGNNTWKVNCIDHDKPFPAQMERCEHGAQVLCLKY